MKDEVAVAKVGAMPAWTLARGLRWPASLNTRTMDRLEQGLLLVFFGVLCWRLLPDSLAMRQWNVLMMISSEFTILFFVLIRRPTDQITVDPFDWLVAFGGTMAPLLIGTGSATSLSDLGLMMILIGWFIHAGAKLTLRRSFGVVAANRGIKTAGIYGLVRHPMYLGYVMTHVGFFLSASSIWNVLVCALAWSCFVIRIQAEERVLGNNAEYRDYKAKVRYRLIPFVW
jgi:protein-S-isoprenylcysteine O-methyltransferase Ste14